MNEPLKNVAMPVIVVEKETTLSKIKHTIGAHRISTSIGTVALLTGIATYLYANKYVTYTVITTAAVSGLVCKILSLNCYKEYRLNKAVQTLDQADQAYEAAAMQAVDQELQAMQEAAMQAVDQVDKVKKIESYKAACLEYINKLKNSYFLQAAFRTAIAGKDTLYKKAEKLAEQMSKKEIAAERILFNARIAFTQVNNNTTINNWLTLQTYH